MYINITAFETGSNKGSSGALVNYLEKENRLQDEKDKGLAKENWFNGSAGDISRQEVRMKIDRNVAKLGRNDSKFFLINISPSQKELAHLFAKYGEEGAKEKLKEFSIKVMDEYAKNFKRPGINSHKNLVWFGKHENYRYYNYTDKEVKNGTKQRGERKEGRQMHIQIIVSRKDISNTIKLSPQNTSRGKNKEHSQKLGQFDRIAFKQSGECLFDDYFDFERGLKDTLNYANVMKNGTATQKAQMQFLGNIQYQQSESLYIIKEIGNQVTRGLYNSLDVMLSSITKLGGDLLNTLLMPVYSGGSDVNPFEEALKRKKKKKRGQDQSMGMSL
jgi:hypothetical protein